MRIIENEQQHRIKTEQYALTARDKAIKRGNYLGALVSVAAIAGAAFVATVGAGSLVPLFMVAVPVSAIFGAWVPDLFARSKNNDRPKE